MPIGSLSRVVVKQDEIDPNTGVVTKKYVPKEPLAKLIEASKRPDFQLHDKINEVPAPH
jgi:hypothetical protein